MRKASWNDLLDQFRVSFSTQILSDIQGRVHGKDSGRFSLVLGPLDAVKSNTFLHQLP